MSKSRENAVILCCLGRILNKKIKKIIITKGKAMLEASKKKVILTTSMGKTILLSTPQLHLKQ